MTPENCGNCRFGITRTVDYRTHGHTYIECRRYPEVVSKRTEDWCGEYQPIAGGIEPPATKQQSPRKRKSNNAEK